MNNHIVVESDSEFTKTICEIIKEQSILNIKEKGYFTLVLSGGNTPKQIFQELSKNYLNDIEWENIHCFWLDERCVPVHDINSNYKLANDYLFSNVGKIGSINKIEGHLEPTSAATLYTKEIKNFFGKNEISFDFVLLGMGEDGHVASLFPNSEELEKKDKLVLNTSIQYNSFYRITLGLNIINKIKFKLLVLKGNKKLEVLTSDKNLPINLVKEKVIVSYNNES